MKEKYSSRQILGAGLAAIGAFVMVFGACGLPENIVSHLLPADDVMCYRDGSCYSNSMGRLNDLNLFVVIGGLGSAVLGWGVACKEDL
jgi:hypothetical protein